MSKNVAVFVDVANVFYAAKAAGVDIDYVTLLKSASAGRDLVRAYAYTGLDPDNENQRNFHDFLRRSGYKVVSKDIRKYGDGKVKANLDIELVVDMMKTARNLDIAIVVSGDGDFAPAIRAVQEQGVRVEVISFRGNTSSDLIDVADIFTDITQLAKVEKGSSRSGRRVASDDDDLSMTEVPDKQTEGSGDGRGRSRSRGRTRDGEAGAPSRGRGRGRLAGTESVAAMTATGLPLVALPGEKLARAASSGDEAPEPEPVAASDAGDEADEDRDAPARRRRRRGGRGRGRGRGEETGSDATGSDATTESTDDDRDEADDTEVAAASPRPPRSAAFGAVWTSQIGAPQSSPSRPIEDDEDFDEPEIPEYLIAERRSPGGQISRGGQGGRGVRSGYSAAVDRERYGRGGGGGINRYPDVRPREGGRDRDRDRDRLPGTAPRSSGGDPWSEVPPELEAMLRAQVAKRPKGPAPVPMSASSAEPVEADALAAAAAPAADAAPKRRSTRRPSGVTEDVVATATPKRRTTRTAVTRDAAGSTDAVALAPKPRAPRKIATSTSAAAPTEATAAPKRRTTRTSAEASATAAPAEATAAPKRRTTRKAASTDAS